MNTNEIARRLVELCRQGAYAQAQDELFADDARSVEPDFAPEPIATGRAALAAKGKMFEEMFEVHGGTVSDPVVADAFFSCAMSADVTDRKSGVRFTMEEICVYEVRDGRIVREQFFYAPPA